MKLNKQRQQMYLDGKVGLINDNNDVEQLREVTNDRVYMGKFTYYHKNRIFPSDSPLDNVQYQPTSWFYIATPIYAQPFTLENGTEIEITQNDIDKIKKM